MNGSASSVILAAVIGLIFASFLPEVEDPWPETIGLGFPFTLAGAGAIVGLVLAMSTSQSSGCCPASVAPSGTSSASLS
jgi:hypothetical protein